MSPCVADLAETGGADGKRDNPKRHPISSVRIFCTSSDYYKPPNAPFSAANSLIDNTAIPIEYPSNPDAAVDDLAIPFKERGLRGKAGSAPPFDLDKGARGFPRAPGRMASVTFGHTGPTTGKKKDVTKVSSDVWPIRRDFRTCADD